MGGKVKGRRLLIVLSPEEERLARAAAEAMSSPLASYIRRAAVKFALEGALALDDELHYSGRPARESLGSELRLYKVGREMLTGPNGKRWIEFLRHGSWPHVPSGMQTEFTWPPSARDGVPVEVPPWSQRAVAHRVWAPSGKPTPRKKPQAGH